jgi:hypothetical protein
MTLQRATAALVALLAIILLVTWARAEGPLRSPDQAFDDFVRAEGRAEDQLTDPLVLAGPRVRPVVLAAVQDRGFKLRRYAIRYLGCTRYGRAAPVFKTIVEDQSEQDSFRADALEAIWSMNPDEGHVLATTYSSRSDLLGTLAKGLLSGEAPAKCRTLTDALLHRHE